MALNAAKTAASVDTANRYPKPSPAELLCSGVPTTIRLLPEMPGLRSQFSFRGICCKNGTSDGPPSRGDFPALPAGVDFVLYPACRVEATLPRLSFGRDGFLFTRTWANFVVDLEGDFDSYSKNFSSKSRCTTRAKLRKLSRAFPGSVDWAEYRSPAEMEKFYSAARNVPLGRYQQKVLRNAMPNDAKFYHELMQLASRDAARGYLLWVNRQPVAYLYCIVSDQALVHELSGYDSRFAAFSPGLLLQQYALQQIFSEKRFSIFDFSSGSGQHKKFFSTSCVTRANVYFFRPTPRSAVVLSAAAAQDLVASELRDLVDRLGLQSAARRVVRWIAT